jgi:hypothetical protein
VQDDYRYARQYSNSNKNFANDNVIQSIPAQAPGASAGGDKVSFPSSRRRRDTDQVVPASIEKKENLASVEEDLKDSEGRALNAEKVRNKVFDSRTIHDIGLTYRDKLSINRNNVVHVQSVAENQIALHSSNSSQTTTNAVSETLKESTEESKLQHILTETLNSENILGKPLS